MKIGSMFPSKYLRASDLDAPRLLTMAHVNSEPMPDGEEKPVVYFTEDSKGLVLNKTNYNTVVNYLGTDESEVWVGKKIVLFSATVQQPGGKMGPGIRVRPPKQAPAKTVVEEMDDEIPF